MEIRKAKSSDKETILHLLDSGREIMRRNGNPLQWPDGYPNPETIDTDITQGVSYLCLEDGKAVGTFAMIPGPDPTYATIYQGRWIDNTLPYLVVHRMASLPDSHGIFRACLEYCNAWCNNIRIDTHRDNHILQHNLQKHGFSYCGIIHIANGDERLAYQRILSR